MTNSECLLAVYLLLEKVAQSRFMIAFGSKVENHEADLGETLLKAICHHKDNV